MKGSYYEGYAPSPRRVSVRDRGSALRRSNHITFLLSSARTSVAGSDSLIRDLVKGCSSSERAFLRARARPVQLPLNGAAVFRAAMSVELVDEQVAVRTVQKAITVVSLCGDSQCIQVGDTTNVHDVKAAAAFTADVDLFAAGQEQALLNNQLLREVFRTQGEDWGLVDSAGADRHLMGVWCPLVLSSARWFCARAMFMRLACFVLINRSTPFPPLKR